MPVEVPVKPRLVEVPITRPKELCKYGVVPQVRLLCDCEHESDTLEVARAIKLYMVSKTSCEVSCARCLVVGNEIGIDVRKLRIEADNRTQPDFKWLQDTYVCPDVR